MFNKINKAKTQQLFENDLIITILYFLTSTLPTFTYAQASESPIGQGLGYVVNNFIYGADGVTIAILAVGGTFVAALFHKIPWSVFLLTFAAVAGVFGSPAIVNGIKSLVTT